MPDELYSKFLSRCLNEFSDAVLFSGSDYKILGFSLLQYQPLGLDKVTRMPPVTLGVKISEVEAVLKAKLYSGKSTGYLASDESLTADGGLMVE